MENLLITNYDELFFFFWSNYEELLFTQTFLVFDELPPQIPRKITLYSGDQCYLLDLFSYMDPQWNSPSYARGEDIGNGYRVSKSNRTLSLPIFHEKLHSTTYINVLSSISSLIWSGGSHSRTHYPMRQRV